MTPRTQYFQTVFEAFSQTSNCALTVTEFFVEELLGEAIAGHTGDMTCPSRLGLARDDGDPGEVCPLQNLSIGDFVLPADVMEVVEASEMEVVEDLFMPSARLHTLQVF